MKKTILIAGLAILALASCKKEKTCTCTTHYTDGTTYEEKTVMKGTIGKLYDECGNNVETKSKTVDGQDAAYTNCELD